MPYGSNKDLPTAVQKMPEAAQTVWRKAFNGMKADVPEKQRFKMAWGAVKRAGYRQDASEAWSKDEALAVADGGQLHRVAITERIVLDAAGKYKPKRTSDGFFVAMPRIARTGIQIYKGSEVGRPEMDEVRVYRSEAEVFSRDAMHSFAHRPVTMDHPPELVTADNWKEYAVGQTGDEVLRDGDFLRVPMVLMDAAAITRVMEGKDELSCGYTMDFRWQAGETSQGEAYDAVQSTIRGNHVAVVTMARGGPKLNLGDGDDENESLDETAGDGDNGNNDVRERGEDVMNTANLKTISVDGIEVQMTDTAASVVQRAISALTRQLDEFKLKQGQKEEEDKKGKDALVADHAKVIGEKDAKIATLEKQLKDAKEGASPAALDALVKDRATVVQLGRALIGDKLVTDGKGADDIRRQCVETIMGTAAKDWKDEQIRSSFDTLSAGVRDQRTNGGGQSRAHRPSGGQYDFAQRDAVADALQDGLEPRGLDHYDQMETMYAARDEALENAYRFPNSGGIDPRPRR